MPEVVRPKSLEWQLTVSTILWLLQRYHFMELFKQKGGETWVSRNTSALQEWQFIRRRGLLIDLGLLWVEAYLVVTRSALNGVWLQRRASTSWKMNNSNVLLAQLKSVIDHVDLQHLFLQEHFSPLKKNVAVIEGFLLIFLLQLLCKEVCPLWRLWKGLCREKKTRNGQNVLNILFMFSLVSKYHCINMSFLTA